MLDRGLSRIFDVRTREDARKQQQDTLIPVRLLWQQDRCGQVWSHLVVTGCVWQLAPSQVTGSDHPGPIGREAEDVELPSGGKCGMK